MNSDQEEPTLTSVKVEEEQQEELVATSSTTRKSWKDHEDRILCHAWKSASTCLMDGTDLRGENFWKKVSELYHSREETKGTSVPLCKMITHFTVISNAVAKFCGCMDDVRRQDPGGASEDALLCQALLLFTKVGAKKTAFNYYSCYLILRKLDKWRGLFIPEEKKKLREQKLRQRAEEKRGRATPAAVANDDSEQDQDARPVVRRQARKPKFTTESLLQELCRRQEESNVYRKQLVEEMKKGNELSRKSYEIKQKSFEMKQKSFEIKKKMLEIKKKRLEWTMRSSNDTVNNKDAE